MSRGEKWIQEVEQQLLCPRCHSSQNTSIQLQCSHIFCLLCTAYSYIKFEAEVQSEREIKCIDCKKISILSSLQLELIKETIQNKLIPIIAQEYNLSTENKFIKSKRNSSNQQQRIQDTIDKKMRSQQHSFQNITPSTKYFFSKCQSPNEKYKSKNKQYCSIHDMAQINFICFTCQNHLLCLKCISNKFHKNHEIKNIKKGVEYLYEQISLGKLQTTQKIQCLEMWQRRLQHGKLFLTDRSEKTSSEIQYCFLQLEKKIKNKKQQLLFYSKNHFNNLIRQINDQYQKIKKKLNDLRQYLEKLSAVIKVTSHHSFVGQFNKLKSETSHSLIGSLEPKLLEKISYQPTSMHNDISQISEYISRIKVDYKPVPISQPQLQKSRSDKKIKKQDVNSKRVKTNFASLNSSRDRRQNKYTKTQEDQNKFKQKNKIKNLKHGGKELPSYITKFFDKHNIKPYHNGISCLLDFPMPGDSKASSKFMSKTVLPQELEKYRKKANNSNPKDRLERKTANPFQGKINRSEYPKKKKVC